MHALAAPVFPQLDLVRQQQQIDYCTNERRIRRIQEYSLSPDRLTATFAKNRGATHHRHCASPFFSSQSFSTAVSRTAVSRTAVSGSPVSGSAVSGSAVSGTAVSGSAVSRTVLGSAVCVDV